MFFSSWFSSSSSEGAIAKTINDAKAQISTKTLREADRVALLKASKELSAALEAPKHAIIQLVYAVSKLSAVRVCTDLNVFEHITGKGSVTSSELAELTGADRVLIERFLRVLAATKFVEETSEYTYAPNDVTRALALPQHKATIESHFDMGLKNQYVIPEYLIKTNYRSPSDRGNGPFQYARGIKDVQFFQWLAQNSHEQRIMGEFFQADRGGRPDWFEWFPVQQELLNDSKGAAIKFGNEDIVLVDVGGGHGHDLRGFVKKFGYQGVLKNGGRFVLQDFAPVLKDIEIDLDSRIEKKAMDYCTEPPTAGARIYFMKYILHSWTADDRLRILENIKWAMRKGHSFLVIEDFVLADKGSHLLPALLDVVMMGFMSARERTRSQFVNLMQAANLNIIDIFSPPGDGSSIIVCSL